MEREAKSFSKSKQLEPTDVGTELHEMSKKGDQLQVKIKVAGDELERQVGTTTQKRGNK